MRNLKPSFDDGNALFGKPRPAHGVGTARVELRHLPPGRQRLTQRRTGFEADDARTPRLKMGSPKDFDAKRLSQLQGLTADEPELEREVRVGANGPTTITVELRSHDVVRPNLRKIGD